VALRRVRTHGLLRRPDHACLRQRPQIQQAVQIALGVTLLLAPPADRPRVPAPAGARHQVDGSAEPLPQGRPAVSVRILPTIAVGRPVAWSWDDVGGSGSLIIIALMVLYPSLKASELVGTDLLQAVPLVASAALGHMLFGSFQLGLTFSIVLGSIPGVWIGAQLSARAPGGLVRRALAFVLLASSLRLLGVPNAATVVILGATLCLGPILWIVVRRRHGLPALARKELLDDHSLR